jgi:hypothetical protein
MAVLAAGAPLRDNYHYTGDKAVVREEYIHCSSFRPLNEPLQPWCEGRRVDFQTRSQLQIANTNK